MTGTWRCVVVVVGVCAWLVGGGYVHYKNNDLYGNTIKHSQNYNVKPDEEEEEEVEESELEQDPYHFPSTNGILAVVGRTLVDIMKIDECIERVLCELGLGVSHLEMAHFLVGVVLGYVPPQYARYVMALQSGVMRTSQCDFYCGVFGARDEL